MMKRIFSFLAAALFICACSSTDRAHQLKVYNWADYIDEELIEEFEQWYEEQTGEKVEVIYQTFDINETMLSKIEKGQEDYDVVCPSDYIIERMLMQDLLLPIDRDFGNTPNYIDENIAPFIKKAFDNIIGYGNNANDYAVGYMWGTTGILYNTRYVDAEDAKTWNIIRNPKYDQKIFIKDAYRDVYGPVIMTLRQKGIQDGRIDREELMFDSSDESLAEFEAYMKQVKPLVAGWEADFGKEQMTQEKGYVNLTWSGDAVWAMEEAEEVGVSLNYVVPEEGSNIWFDGWVIPKYAKNVKAAKYFINFLCMPENAVRNMDYIGYVSAIGGETVLEAIQDEDFEPLDLRYMFGEEASAVCANPVLYPDQSVIDRCCMMHDWGEEAAKGVAVWGRIKGEESGNPVTLIVIGLALVVLAVLGFRSKFNKSRRGSSRRGRR